MAHAPDCSVVGWGLLPVVRTEVACLLRTGVIIRCESHKQMLDACERVLVQSVSGNLRIKYVRATHGAGAGFSWS